MTTNPNDFARAIDLQHAAEQAYRQARSVNRLRRCRPRPHVRMSTPHAPANAPPASERTQAARRLLRAGRQAPAPNRRAAAGRALQTRGIG